MESSGSADSSASEIRVHGIGDHNVWSALGSPPIIDRPEKFGGVLPWLLAGPRRRLHRRRGVILAGPPETTPHRLMLVNWSRMSRTGSALVWYLAFPFTLLNVAYEMRPTGKVRSTIHVLAVTAAALLLTAITTCWATAIMESLLSNLDLPASFDHYRPIIAVAVTAGAMASIALFRAMQRAESRAHQVSSWVHTSVVLGTSAFGLLMRPSELTVAYESPLHLFTEALPTDQQLAQTNTWVTEIQQSSNVDAALAAYSDRMTELEDAYPNYVDPIGTAACISLLLMVALCFLVLLTSRRSQRGPAAGASLAIFLSFSILTLVLSSVRAGLAQMLSEPKWVIFGEADPEAPDSVWLMRFDGVSESTQLIPLLAAVLVVTVFAVLLVAALFLGLIRRARGNAGERPVKEGAGEKVRWLRLALWVHRTIGNIGSCVWWTMAASTIISGVLMLAFLKYIDFSQWCPISDPECEAAPYSVRMATIAAGVAVVVFYGVRKVNNTPALRQTLASVADIAGFWPITIQPFGARTYRPYAVAGISDALALAGDRPTVLVGHSQGSVLVPWTLGSIDGTVELPWPPKEKLALVTCGCPLKTLYATFFPSFFDDGWFGRVEQRVTAWVNFWRGTDPIASPLGVGTIRDVLIPDPAPDAIERKLLAHSDYWVASDQKRFIGKQLAEMEDVKSSTTAVWT